MREKFMICFVKNDVFSAGLYSHFNGPALDSLGYKFMSVILPKKIKENQHTPIARGEPDAVFAEFVKFVFDHFPFNRKAGDSGCRIIIDVNGLDENKICYKL